jgi:hypothetical protein
MELKIGEPIYLCGNYKDVRNELFSLSVRLQAKYKKILFIDTLNNLNPHHKAYKSISEKEILRNIFCVRAEKPYDLLARLKTTENFIKNKRIRALLVNPLNIIFEDSHKDEIIPMLNNILEIIYYLTKKFRLVTIIGNISHHNENIMKAAAILLAKENVVMV